MVNGNVILISNSTCTFLYIGKQLTFCLLVLSSRRFVHQFFQIFYIDNLRKSFVFSFPNCMLFTSFSCLIAWNRTSSIISKSSDEKGYPYLVPDLGGKASSFSFFIMVLAIGFLYMSFIKLKKLPSISFLRDFSHER